LSRNAARASICSTGFNLLNVLVVRFVDIHPDYMGLSREAIKGPPGGD